MKRMKKTLAIIMVALIFTSVAPVTVFANAASTIVNVLVPPTLAFERVYFFTDGVAEAYRHDGRRGYIDRTGTFFYSRPTPNVETYGDVRWRLDWSPYFQESIVDVETGEIVVFGFEYDRIEVPWGGSRDGLIVVQRNGLWGILQLEAAGVSYVPVPQERNIYGLQHLPFRYVVTGTFDSTQQLPEGLVYAHGVISGTPTAAGIFTFVVQINSVATYTLEIVAATPDFAAIIRDGTGPDGFADPGFEIWSEAAGDPEDGFIGVLPYEGAALRVVTEVADHSFILRGAFDDFARLWWYDHAAGRLELLRTGIDYVSEEASTRHTIQGQTFGSRNPGRHTIISEFRPVDAVRPQFAAQTFELQTPPPLPPPPAAPVVAPVANVPPPPPVATVAAPAVVPSGTSITHTVVSGDTLWGIAHRFLGNGVRFPEIHEVNRNIIGPNPGLIFPGQNLYIYNR